jgi:TatD DNase family protein
MGGRTTVGIATLIDTHCHLDALEFVADRDAVVARAVAAGVAALVLPAVEVHNFSAVRDCCARYALCVPAYGLHPIYIERTTAADLQTLRAWLAHESLGCCPPVALGEIGLDFFIPGFDQVRQETLFVEQLKIARDFELPVLLHSRRAVDRVLKHLRRIRVRGGIAHAFNGSRQQADEFIKLGFKIGLGGAMTYAGSTRIRHLATTLPLESLVLETDAPDIPPEFIGRARNAPEHLPRIAALLADLRGIRFEEVAAATTANALALLPGLAFSVFRG